MDFASFQQQKGMKFGMSISVQDIRQRTRPTTHEKHEI